MSLKSNMRPTWPRLFSDKNIQKSKQSIKQG